mgnify:FL=1
MKFGTDSGSQNPATATGLTTVDIRTFVSRIIRYFLSLLGIIAVVLIMYAGFLWMTAGGNAEKIEQAKKIITNAVIGLIIITSAYAIVLFIFRALTGELGPGGGSSGPPARLTALFSGNRGNDALGNGIVDYHYPEPGQTGVPRNTKVSITFKKPLVLSTVFKNYDDNNTYRTDDDRLCAGAPPCPTRPLVSTLTDPVFELNTANVRLIANDSLIGPGTGTVDQQFDTRYCGEEPCNSANDFVEATAKVTSVRQPDIDPLQYQTMVFKPLTAIGSPSTDMNYRVALRGGENGVKVWNAPPAGGDPEMELGFGRAFADGGYFWPFTVSTFIDTTPPRIVALVPGTTPVLGTPPGSVLDRNQLLQIYFDEAVDPTSASGQIGEGGGFTNIEVMAECLGGASPPPCTFNGGSIGTVNGTLLLGNRYRTAEFTPSTECEGGPNGLENSCGEKVYCLPKNVRLVIRARAATVGSEPPEASEDNGVVDMVDNSLDGNENGTAQGPQGMTCTPAGAQPGGRCGDFYRNAPPADLSAVSDTARWEYHVGSNIDLTVPLVTHLDPPTQVESGLPSAGTEYPAGPSKIPTALEPGIAWSKTMSIGSMRSGGFNEPDDEYGSPTSTLVLRSKECAKTSEALCPGVDPDGPLGVCPCTDIDPPGFFIDAGMPVDRAALAANPGYPNCGPGVSTNCLGPCTSGNCVTRTRFVHPFRAFYTANDLGYTDAEIDLYEDNVPVYAPIARAQIKDTKQNCFWPSQYKPAGNDGSECLLAGQEYSCCKTLGSPDDSFLSDCAP